MIFSDFTENLAPAQTDFLAGYATGGGAGSDRRFQIGNLFKKSTSLLVGSAAGGNAGIELGDVSGVGGQSFIDFHTGTTVVDYDARLLASGATGVAGGAQLLFSGANFSPQTNDAAPLGVGGGSPLGWSDLFLASGGAVNFANGDYTLTHLTGGLLAATSNASAMMLALQQNDSGAQGAIINLFHNSTTTAVNDRMGGLWVQGRNTTPANFTYSKFTTDLLVSTAGSEAAAQVFETAVAGTLAERLRITNSPIIYNGTAIPAGGNQSLGYKATSTANFGIYFGSGNPTVSAAKGSLYLKSNGTTTNDRAYINTDGGTTWTALTTAA